MPNPDTMAGSQASGSPTTPASLLQNPALLQFVKFCIVGASNFGLDFTVSTILYYRFHFTSATANTISFLLSVSNSFYWNRRWTFNAANKKNQDHRYVVFVIINLVGLGIIQCIIHSVTFAVTGSWDHRLTVPVWIAAKLIATSVVVFWNFFANKRWTFKV